MDGAALAAERLASEMESRRGDVEAYLALGATPARAAAEPMRRALVAALIPVGQRIDGGRPCSSRG